MSYWGSHFSGLRNEEEEGIEKESDPDRQLRDQLCLTREQLEEAKECFKLCDTSGKGKLTGVELKAVLRAGGEDPDEEDIREIMYEIDRDGDGVVDFIDFVHFMHKTLKKPIGEEDIEQCFKMIDGEENEFITMRGLEKIFLALGQQRTDEELRDMVGFIDSQDDEGLIRFDDFKRYLVKQNLLRREEEEDELNEEDSRPGKGSKK